MLRSAALALLLCSIASAGTVSVRVVDEDGKPVEGATVEALWWSDIDLSGPHATLVSSSSRTDAKGMASARTEAQHVCLLAFEGGRAVFACHTPVEHVGRAEFALKLGSARAVHGQIVDAKGAPVDKARVRLLFAGGYEWHGIDASVGKDGAFTFAPLPDDVLARRVRLQAMAPGMAAFEVELTSRDVDAAVPVRMVGTRRVTGRVVDMAGAPVPAAEIRTGASMDEEGVRTAKDGTFEIPDASAGPLTLEILPPHHASKSVDVYAGSEAKDVGTIRVEAGKPVQGIVREFDGARILHAFIALENADGVRVRTAEPGPDGSFTLEAVGDGPHRLDCWVHEVEGVGGSRHLSRRNVVAGAPPLDLVVPEGLRVQFVDAKGKPCMVDQVDATIRSGAFEEPWTDDFQSQTPFSELRLLLPRGLVFDLELRPEGYEEVTISSLLTDVKGRLTVTATLVPDGDHPASLHRGRPSVPLPRFDEHTNKDEVREYVRKILEDAGQRTSWSTDDPECAGLKEVGRAHVDVLVEALIATGGGGHGGGSRWLVWAISALSDDSNKKVILGALPKCHDLAECVVLNSWQADARDTLLDALRERPRYLPPEWITAVALLRDPKTYDLLLQYLAEGANPHMTWRAIRDLAGLDARETVARAWANRNFFESELALVAVEFGHVDALGVLIDSLGGERVNPWTAEVILRRTGVKGDAKTLRAWFQENREKLRFDEKDGVYKVSP